MAKNSVFQIVVMGPPGSGKTTQAEKLAAYLKVPLVATGELFRRIAKENNNLGREIKNYLDKGEILPDNLTANLVKRLILTKEYQNGFIGEGFPRTLPQAKMLDKQIKQAIYLKVSEAVVIRRLLARRLCPLCGENYNLIFQPPRLPNVCDRCGGSLIQRTDDNQETITHRLKIYHRQTEPVLNYYQKEAVLVQVDGEKAVEAIFDDILTRLKIKKLND